MRKKYEQAFKFELCFFRYNLSILVELSTDELCNFYRS